MPAGRPIEYNQDYVIKTEEYLKSCVDEIEEYHKTRGEKSDGYDRLVRVKLPTIEGLAVYLGVNKTTIYEWEKIFGEFSNVIDKLRAIQADRLINNGLSSDYNPVIAKVLLTKHGYREGLDQTTNDKELPTPIINVQRDNIVSEDKPTQEAN